MLRWLFHRPSDHGLRSARQHAADADATLPKAEELERGARQLQRENNFAASIRHAMKGR